MIYSDTIPGKTYAVTTRYGCTVGVPDMPDYILLELDANKQGYFVACSTQVYVTDDTAKVTEVFKLAPWQRLALLGVLGGGDPAWFKQLNAELSAMLDGSQFETAWLAGEKKLVVHTDRVSDELLAAVKATAEAAMPEGAVLVQYNHNMEVSWRDINKYAECTNRADMLAVNPDYKNDLTSDGEWVYPLPEMVQAGGYRTSIFDSAESLRKIKLVLPKAQNIGFLCYETNKLEELDIEAPELNGSDYIACAHIIQGYVYPKKIRIVLPKQRYLDQLFWSIHVCAPKSVEIVAPMMESAQYMFDYLRLNKEDALRFLRQLRTFTSGNHPLGIQIHVDYQNDDEVLEALTDTEAKGWTLTVKWSGTPTAQAATTYGLRKPPIYARVSEMERPDGTTERVLDWGHYVTDPTGYTEFPNLDAALEEWGLHEITPEESKADYERRYGILTETE